MPCITLLNKRGQTKGILLKNVFIPKLPNNSQASCYLISFDFSLLHTTQFHESIFSTLQTIVQ